MTLAAAGRYWGGGGLRAGVRSWVPPVMGPGSACAGGAGARPYLGPRDCCGLGDMMIDGCDVRPHVVSEYVEGGWLMPGT